MAATLNLEVSKNERSLSTRLLWSLSLGSLFLIGCDEKSPMVQEQAAPVITQVKDKEAFQAKVEQAEKDRELEEQGLANEYDLKEKKLELDKLIAEGANETEIETARLKYEASLSDYQSRLAAAGVSANAKEIEAYLGAGASLAGGIFQAKAQTEILAKNARLKARQAELQKYTTDAQREVAMANLEAQERLADKRILEAQMKANAWARFKRQPIPYPEIENPEGAILAEAAEETAAAEEADADADAPDGADADAKADAGDGTGAGAGAGAGDGAKADAGDGADAEIGDGAKADAGNGTGDGTGAGAADGAGAGAKADAGDGAGAGGVLGAQSGKAEPTEAPAAPSLEATPTAASTPANGAAAATAAAANAAAAATAAAANAAAAATAAATPTPIVNVKVTTATTAATADSATDSSGSPTNPDWLASLGETKPYKGQNVKLETDYYCYGSGGGSGQCDAKKPDTYLSQMNKGLEALQTALNNCMESGSPYGSNPSGGASGQNEFTRGQEKECYDDQLKRFEESVKKSHKNLIDYIELGILETEINEADGRRMIAKIENNQAALLHFVGEAKNWEDADLLGEAPTLNDVIEAHAAFLDAEKNNQTSITRDVVAVLGELDTESGAHLPDGDASTFNAAIRANSKYQKPEGQSEVLY